MPTLYSLQHVGPVVRANVMTADTTGGFADFYAAHFQRLAVQLHAYLGDHAEAPDRIALKEALASLPVKHRQAVVQFYIGHMSTVEIAEQEGVAEGTVRSWLSRGRSELATHFAEFEASSPVKSAGVAAATETVRRRRRTRLAVVAAMVILALAIPIAVVLANRRSDQPPVVTPSPSISPTPAQQNDYFLNRNFGGLKDVKQVDVLSSEVIWALSRSEDRLLLTTDGAKTWREVHLPEHTRDSLVQVLPYSERELIVRIGEAVYVSVDGGTTYSVRSLADPGKLAMLADWRQRTAEKGSTYGWGCRGYRWFPNGLFCDKQDVVKIGTGPLPVQPELPGNISQVINTDDGRVWVQARDDSQTYIAYSYPSKSDKSWKRLATMHVGGALHVSPDGKDVWFLSAYDSVWRLSEGTWQTSGLPASTDDIVPVGTGMLYAVVNQANGESSVALWDGNLLRYTATFPTCDQTMRISAIDKTNLLARCGSTVYVFGGKGLRIAP